MTYTTANILCLQLQEVYQYVFSRETHFPFTLFISALRSEMPLKDGNEQAADYPIQDTLLIVQSMDNEDNSLDDFLSLLLEVCTYTPVFLYNLFNKLFSLQLILEH